MLTWCSGTSTRTASWAARCALTWMRRAALAGAGEPLGFSAEQTAAAAVRIVDSQMADAIRLVTVNVGRDPRDFVLYIYGGAGGVHARALAKELGIRTLVLPLSDLASGWSAFGVAVGSGELGGGVDTDGRPVRSGNPQRGLGRIRGPGRGRHRFARHRDGADDVGAFRRNPL